MPAQGLAYEWELAWCPAAGQKDMHIRRRRVARATLGLGLNVLVAANSLSRLFSVGEGAQRQV